MPQSDLTRKLDRKFVSGLAWTTGSKWLIQGVSWASLVVVARLLTPSDFGLVEMAAIVIFFSQTIFDFGLGNAIIQMRELSDATLRQINVLVVTLAFVAYGFVALLAPPIATFFEAEQLRTLLLVNSLVFFLQAGQLVPANALRRDLDYRTLAASEMIQSLFQLSTTLIAAFSGLAFWSLVMGQIAGQSAACIFVNFRRRVGYARPRWNEVREAVRFGTHLGVGQFAQSIYSQSDTLAVGRNLDANMLGNYRMAMSIAVAPIDKVASLISRVTAPMFSHVQDDPALMRRYLLRFTEILTVVAIPASVGMACVAEELVPTAFGTQWAAAIVPLRWLCAIFVFRCFSILIAQAMFALRESRFMMKLALVSAVVMPILFWIASYNGIEAVAAIWLANVPLGIVPASYVLLRRIHLPVGVYLRAALPATASAFLMAIVVLAVRMYIQAELPSIPVYQLLLIEILVGALCYAGILAACFRNRVQQYLQFLITLKSEATPAQP